MEIKVSKLYEDLPVTITDVEFYDFTGIDLNEELNTGGVDDRVVIDFLNSAHESVYYSCIYKVGGKRLKDNVILGNLETLTKPLKMALSCQLKYMLDSGGDYGVVDGSSISAEGELKLTVNNDIKNKIIAPKVFEILNNSRPNLIMGWEF